MFERVYLTLISVILYSCLFRLLNADIFTDTKVMFRINEDFDCVYDKQEYQVQDGDTVTTGIYSQFNIALAEFIHVDKYGSEPRTIFTSEKFRFDSSINYGNFDQVIVNKLFEGQWDFGFYLNVISLKQIEHVNKIYTYVSCYISVNVEDKPNNDTRIVDFLLPSDTNCTLTGNVGKYQVYENEPLSFRMTSAFKPSVIQCAVDNREEIFWYHDTKDLNECFPRQPCWTANYKITAKKSSHGNWTCVFRSQLDTTSNCTFSINVPDRVPSNFKNTYPWIIYSAGALLVLAGSSFTIWIVRVVIRRRRARCDSCAVMEPSSPITQEQHSNLYEEVYDDVYEARRNRQRLIEKLLREMNTKRPPPPPVETMPREARRAPAASSVGTTEQSPQAEETAHKSCNVVM